MEFKATSKLVRISPRKARMVADAVKEFSPIVAGEKLQFLAKAGAEPIYKTLQSAIANATHGGKVAEGALKIKNILINEGTRMRRQDTSHRPGKSGIIHKQTSHITVILSDNKNQISRIKNQKYKENI